MLRELLVDVQQQWQHLPWRSETHSKANSDSFSFTKANSFSDSVTFWLLLKQATREEV
jgi:hypothetical protein